MVSGLAAAASAAGNGSSGFAFESVEEMFPDSYQVSNWKNIANVNMA